MTTTDPVKDAVRDHWSRRAATFDQAPNHSIHNEAQRAAWHRHVQAWSGPEQIDVFDIGCGTGFFSLQFAALGDRVRGLDISPEMVELARAKAAEAQLDVDLAVGDVEATGFAQDSFDLAIERHVLWTLPHPDRALAEWRRILRPGGRLILVEGDWRTQPVIEDYATIREGLPLYGGEQAGALTKFVQDAGFTLSTVEPLEDPDLWNQPMERYALIAVA
jgi:ubiquinone/menaquinone biosynthesis C-methylase UbiE